VFRALLLLCRDILRHPLPFAHDKVRHLHATRRVCMTRRVCISLPDLQTPVGWVLSSQHNPISTESTLTLESVASEGAGEGAEEGEGERQGAQGGSCSHLGKLSESGLELLKERSLLRHRVPAPFNNFNELPGGIGCDGWSLVAHLQHQDTTTLMSSRDTSDGRQVSRQHQTRLFVSTHTSYANTANTRSAAACRHTGSLRRTQGRASC
jgi:hypothetical protein